MLNHNQFLLSIVSYFFYLFGEFEEVLILKGKSGEIFFRHLLCWIATTVFAISITTSCVFIQRREILYWENKWDKIENSNKKIKLLFGLVKERAAVVTLLIISAVFTYFQLHF